MFGYNRCAIYFDIFKPREYEEFWTSLSHDRLRNFLLSIFHVQLKKQFYVFFFIDVWIG